jgi:hypothetical protein
MFQGRLTDKSVVYFVVTEESCRDADAILNLAPDPGKFVLSSELASRL